MATVVFLLIVIAVAITAVIIVCVSVLSWESVQRARHNAKGAISAELANELRAELAEIKENLASINQMLREVQ